MSKHLHTRPEELHVYQLPVDSENPGSVVISNTLRAMQQLVGGYLETIKPTHNHLLQCGCRLELVVDEDGRMKERLYNDLATQLAGRVIVGTALVVAVGPCPDSDDVSGTDLPIEDFVTLPQAFAQWKGPGTPFPVDQKQPWEK